MRVSFRRLAKALGIHPATLIRWEEKYLKPLQLKDGEGNIISRYSAEAQALLFVIKQLRYYKASEEVIENTLSQLVEAFSLPLEEGKKLMVLVAKLPIPTQEVIYINSVVGTPEEMAESMRKLGIRYYKLYDISKAVEYLKEGKLWWLSEPVNWQVA